MKKRYRIEFECLIDDVDDVKVFYADGSGEQKFHWLWKCGDYVRKHGKVVEPVTYRYGDEFTDKNGEKCMIIQVGPEECCLADTGGWDKGNRLYKTVKVGNTRAITQSELDEMVGPTFGPVTKIAD